MKAIILDDEPRAAQSLQKMLALVAPEIQVLAVLNDPTEALERLGATAFDLLFLDISMPHLSGFELLERLGRVDFEVVFTTAHDEHAVRAFRLAAADYLLKPIDLDELLAAVETVKKRRSATGDGAEKAVRFAPLDALFQQLQRPERLALPTSEGLIFLPLAEILRLESDSNYTVFFTVKKEKIIVSKTLKEFEGPLEAHGFFRIHNSHIVNLRHIERYVRGEGGTVVLAGGLEIEVSRRRKEDFLKRLEQSALR